VIEQEKALESYKKNYSGNKKILKNKSNKQNFLVARKLAEKDLQSKDLRDPLYSKFFVYGAISYGEIECENR
jgi:hypothetical protein